jgi:hypothetical protein
VKSLRRVCGTSGQDGQQNDDGSETHGLLLDRETNSRS